MFGPIDTVIFDFDGTLVNTMPSVSRGLGEAVRKFSGKNPSDEEIFMTFGPAPLDVLRRWMSEDKVMPALQYWLEFEKTLDPRELIFFKGVPEMLAALKAANIRIAIFTGRDRAGTKRIASSHGWMPKFFGDQEMVCGDDGLPTKPDPAGILKILKIFDADPARTLMVGDHIHDMTAGRRAGVKTAAVLWDLPSTEKTERAAFKKVWNKWEDDSCDLRLNEPASLVQWLTRGAL